MRPLHIIRSTMPPFTHVIANPGAGSAGALEHVLHIVQRRGWALHETKRAGDAERFARRAVDAGCERLIVAGGDGTLNEVINGIAPDFDALTLAPLPFGTGNDLVRCLGVEPQMIEDHVTQLDEAQVIAIDVGCAHFGDETRHFLNASAGGFSGKVDEAISAEQKALWGKLAYVLAALSTLGDVPSYHTRITIDGTPIEAALYSTVICNGRYIAGGVPIAPNALLDDGSFEVLLVPAQSIGQAMLAGLDVMLGRHEESERVLTARGSRIEIECDPPMPFNLDGEACANAPVRYELLNRALRVAAAESACITH